MKFLDELFYGVLICIHYIRNLKFLDEISFKKCVFLHFLTNEGIIIFYFKEKTTTISKRKRFYRWALCYFFNFFFFLVIFMEHKHHSSDIQNMRIFRRCSKRSIFKYFKIWKCEYVKYVNTMSKTLSKLSLSCAQTQRQRWSSIFKYFLKSPKKRIIRVCLNRIESMSLLW
jgi:hypothetical protein